MNNAAQVAEIMQRLAGCGVLIFDRDHVIAVAGTQKKEFSERRASQEMESLMESRHPYYAAERDSAHLRPAAELNRTGDPVRLMCFVDSQAPEHLEQVFPDGLFHEECLRVLGQRCNLS